MDRFTVTRRTTDTATTGILDTKDTLDTLCRCKERETSPHAATSTKAEKQYTKKTPLRALAIPNDDRYTGDRDGNILVLWKAFTKGNKLIGRNQNLGRNEMPICVCAGQRKKGDGTDASHPPLLVMKFFIPQTTNIHEPAFCEFEIHFSTSFLVPTWRSP